MLVFGGEKGEPVTVAHEKARITGRTHEDFRLWIEDVEIDGDPAAGLRVSVMDGTPPAQQSGAERLQELQYRVLAFVEEQGGTTGGANVIAEHLGGRRQTLNAAVAELVRTGRLQRGGTTKVSLDFYPGKRTTLTSERVRCPGVVPGSGSRLKAGNQGTGRTPPTPKRFREPHGNHTEPGNQIGSTALLERLKGHHRARQRDCPT